MKKYQRSIWDGLVMVDIKNNMTKSEVDPPTPLSKRDSGLQYVRSVHISGKRVACEKCSIGAPSVAKHMVTAVFARSPNVRYLMCSKHKRAFMTAFAPYSNTGQFNPNTTESDL